MKFWKLVSATIVLTLSMNASAAIISLDWQASGDNLITRVTGTGPGSGLEWLDLTATTSRSYNDISTKLGSGQEFDGWRYASRVEIGGFWDAFGGDSNHYDGWSTENNGLFELIAPYWGDAYCQNQGCTPGDGQLFAISGDVRNEASQFWSKIYDDKTDDLVDTQALDYFMLAQGFVDLDYIDFNVGHALVREVTAVPVPAAFWLFGSGLLGLIGLARRLA